MGLAKLVGSVIRFTSLDTGVINLCRYYAGVINYADIIYVRWYYACFVACLGEMK